MPDSVINSRRFVDLSGHYLTNDPTQGTLWRVPNGTVIPARGHLLVWADGHTAQGPLHASFTLSEKGQAVALFGPDAAGNGLLDVIAYVSLPQDASYGRRFSGSSLWRWQNAASPAAQNR